MTDEGGKSEWDNEYRFNNFQFDIISEVTLKGIIWSLKTSIPFFFPMLTNTNQVNFLSEMETLVFPSELSVK